MPGQNVVLFVILGNRVTGGLVDGDHSFVLLHGQFGDFIHKAFRHIAIHHGKVPHGNHTRRLVQRLIGACRNNEFRYREVISNLLCFLIGHANDVYIGLNFQLAHSRNRNACSKSHNINQAILKLTTKIRPAAVTALEVHTQGFHHAREIGVRR